MITDTKFKTAPHLQEQGNELSKVKKVIGVFSGKGGVGKSLVTALLASEKRKKGLNVGVLDADITGPSIPSMFGLIEKADWDDMGIYPVNTSSGIKVMSTNLLLHSTTEPVIWRAPILTDMVSKFWTDVIWDDLDVLFVDMPPGTGDVPLTVFQRIKMDGVIIVTTPQELVSMIVAKAVNMVNKLNIPIIGVVENMSYIECPNCKETIHIFDTNKVNEVATSFDLTVVGQIPMSASISNACDLGMAEKIEAGNYLQEALRLIDVI